MIIVYLKSMEPGTSYGTCEVKAEPKVVQID